MKHEHYMDMNRLSDWSVDQINELLDTCLLLKEMEEKGVRLPLLKDVSLAMMFDQQSTRTRVSFETAMTQLGGHAMFLDGSSLHAGSGQEDIAETAAIISSMADAIMIRSLSQRVIDEVVANSTVPVISGMSCALFRDDGFGSQEQHHPTQVIADLITMIERKPKNKKLYIYERNYEGKKLLVICSFTADQVRFDAPAGIELDKALQVLGNYEMNFIIANGFTTRPYELRVYLIE